MIPTKQMVGGVVLAVASAAAVGQQSFEGWPTNLPRVAKLIDDLPRGIGLQKRTWSDVALMRAADAALATIDPKHKSFMTFRSNLKSTWSGFLQRLAEDYSRIRSEGRDVTVPMMHLLLLCRVSYSKPEADLLRFQRGMLEDSLEERGVRLRDVADDLLRVAETEEERLPAHLFYLHEGDEETRVQTALSLAQMENLATDVMPHLIEELDGDNTRVVQEAITALGMIGPTAKDAIPTLEKLTEHEDPQIAARARAALRGIREGRD